MRKRKHGKVGFYIPREWLERAMRKWARDASEVKRKKEIEIKILKERIKELEKR